MTATDRQRGFTLIEVMVALAVVVLAITALLVQTMGTVDGSNYLREKTIAHWVALNQLELERIANHHNGAMLTEEKSGSTEMMGREWFWRIKPKKTAAKGFLQLELSVTESEDEKAESLVTVTTLVDRFHKR